jgi:hypothetical protein
LEWVEGLLKIESLILSLSLSLSLFLSLSLSYTHTHFTSETPLRYLKGQENEYGDYNDKFKRHEKDESPEIGQLAPQDPSKF